MASRFLEGLGSQLLLEFRTRWYFYISSVIAALIIRVLPSTGIVITSPFTLMVAAVLVVPLIGGVLAAGRFFGLMIQSTLQVVFYNRKHKPEESIDPDLRKLAATYGVEYTNPVYLTYNPSVNSPYTNANKGVITFPAAWNSRYTRELLLGAGMHEVGHIKYRRQFYTEIVGAGGLTTLFSLFLGLRLALPIVLVTEIAFLMLAFTVVARRNELRCDDLAADAVGEDAVIALLEDLGKMSGFDEASETHPAIGYRIQRLIRRKAKKVGSVGQP
jgi:Zn-dependent protease with chaperone function